jgi:hypothetical protein
MAAGAAAGRSLVLVVAIEIDHVLVVGTERIPSLQLPLPLMLCMCSRAAI